MITGINMYIKIRVERKQKYTNENEMKLNEMK